jgi:hypothetical protein
VAARALTAVVEQPVGEPRVEEAREVLDEPVAAGGPANEGSTRTSNVRPSSTSGDK